MPCDRLCGALRLMTRSGTLALPSRPVRQFASIASLPVIFHRQNPKITFLPMKCERWVPYAPAAFA